MKTIAEIDGQQLLIANVVHCDAEGVPLYEEVTCETGSFEIVRLAASDGVLVEDD